MERWGRARRSIPRMPHAQRGRLSQVVDSALLRVGAAGSVGGR
jgi:hypothetical protein